MAVVKASSPPIRKSKVIPYPNLNARTLTEASSLWVGVINYAVDTDQFSFQKENITILIQLEGRRIGFGITEHILIGKGAVADLDDVVEKLLNLIGDGRPGPFVQSPVTTLHR